MHGEVVEVEKAILGVVCSGAGHVHTLPQEVLEGRRRAMGMNLVPGTLNLATPDWPNPGDAPYMAFCDYDGALPGPEHLGELRYWSVRVWIDAPEAREALLESLTERSPGLVTVPAKLVRHIHSRAPYLEIVSDVHFRTLWDFEDGAKAIVVCDCPRCRASREDDGGRLLDA